MLTGETLITNGEMFTQGYNQKYQLAKIHQIIGYCPQFDALLSGLTCRETLEIFAMLRGIPAHDIKHYIENCARSLDFIQHIDKKVKQLRFVCTFLHFHFFPILLIFYNYLIYRNLFILNLESLAVVISEN